MTTRYKKSDEDDDDERATPAHQKEHHKTVKFKTNVSWGGHDFNLVPGDVMDVPEATAKARQAAGLGEIVKET